MEGCRLVRGPQPLKVRIQSQVTTLLSHQGRSHSWGFSRGLSAPWQANICPGGLHTVLFRKLMNSVQIQKILQGCRVKKGKRRRPDKGDPSLLSVRRVTRLLQIAGPPWSGVCGARGGPLLSGRPGHFAGAAGRPCHHGASRSCPQTRKASRRQQLGTEPGNWVTWGEVEGATWIDLEKIRWRPGRARKFPILEVLSGAGAIRTALCAAPEGRAEPGGTDGRGRESGGEEEAFYDGRYSKRMQAPQEVFVHRPDA